jgi:hypothetical protein
MLTIVTARMSGRASSTQAGASSKATMVVLNVLIWAVATGPSAAPRPCSDPAIRRWDETSVWLRSVIDAGCRFTIRIRRSARNPWSAESSSARR